jgi:hypothetical protein
MLNWYSKNSLLELAVWNDSFYMAIYKPIAEKQTEDGKKLPIFRSGESGLAEKKAGAKLSPAELSIFASILEVYAKRGKEVAMKFMSEQEGVHKDKDSSATAVTFIHADSDVQIGCSAKGMYISIYKRSDKEAFFFPISRETAYGIFCYMPALINLSLQWLMNKYGNKTYQKKNDDAATTTTTTESAKKEVQSSLFTDLY